MTTACCPAAPLAVRAHSPQRWLAGLHRAWAAWREHSWRQAENQALEQLSENTRRDLGLGERVPPAWQRTLWEYERGQW